MGNLSDEQDSCSSEQPSIHQFRRESDLNIGGQTLNEEEITTLSKILQNQRIIMDKQDHIDERIKKAVLDTFDKHLETHHQELDPPHHVQHERLGNWIRDLSSFWSEFAKVLAWGLAAILSWGAYDLYKGSEVIKNVLNH